MLYEVITSNIDDDLNRNQVKDQHLTQRTEGDELAQLVLARKAADALIGGRFGKPGDQQRKSREEEAAAEGDDHRLDAAIGDEEAGECAADACGYDGEQNGGPDIERNNFV